MSRRSYAQYCGLAKALDVVGERWTLLVVRNLLLGPLRYSELLGGLPGTTTTLLARRLKEMEEHGLLERIRAAGEGGQAYRLTEVGRALEPAVHPLGRWGWRWVGTPAAGGRRSPRRPAGGGGERPARGGAGAPRAPPRPGGVVPPPLPGRLAGGGAPGG